MWQKLKVIPQHFILRGQNGNFVISARWQMICIPLRKVNICKVWWSDPEFKLTRTQSMILKGLQEQK